jgi:hypothetical protein
MINCILPLRKYVRMKGLTFHKEIIVSRLYKRDYIIELQNIMCYSLNGNSADVLAHEYYFLSVIQVDEFCNPVLK